MSLKSASSQWSHFLAASEALVAVRGADRLAFRARMSHPTSTVCIEHEGNGGTMKVRGIAAAVALLAVSCEGEDAQAEDEQTRLEAADEEPVEEAAIERIAASACDDARDADSAQDGLDLLDDAIAQAAEDGHSRGRVSAAMNSECRDDLRDQAREEWRDENPPDKPEPIPDEDAEEIFAAMVEGEGDGTARDSLVDAIGSFGEPHVESVDLVTYDDGLHIAVTSSFASEERHHEVGWMIFRVLSEVYWTGDIEWMGDFRPDLRLEVNQSSWTCGGDVMERVATARASRSQWEAAC